MNIPALGLLGVWLAVDQLTTWIRPHWIKPHSIPRRTHPRKP